jgi:hypothetical protein
MIPNYIFTNHSRPWNNNAKEEIERQIRFSAFQKNIYIGIAEWDDELLRLEIDRGVSYKYIGWAWEDGEEKFVNEITNIIDENFILPIEN